ncbi:MAG: GNAT family N-acetyltransferase [Phenylobacterium sp.]|uniref:GNAT family N-acetyltransferase n=1 Tax=Phenylobacterium sp. TaxID=1871053 RepID=UPI0011FFE4CF|nr:GNAT family N-acetyltransferase [Phenylobacterium sp.]TAJ69863.1 MAG: GNAT family N-acetyltransferase [Phenylobacterium sp.]
MDAALASLILRQDDLSNPQTQELVRLHLAGMADNSPPGHCFALDDSGLKAPGVTLWSAWRGERIAAIGALKALDGDAGEIKSMRTHPDHLRQGAGAAILDEIIAEARRRGYRRLSLETGSGEAFDAALAMYRARGFKFGGAFSDYVASAFNQFMHLDL